MEGIHIIMYYDVGDMRYMGRKGVVISCQVAFTYIGTVVGAGFASGQEILKFFARYDEKGLLGALLAGVLFAILGGMVVNTTAVRGIKNYEQYVRYLFGTKKAGVFNILILVFLISGLSVMLVASGSLFSQTLGCSPWIGFFSAALIIYVGLLTGIEGILWLNTFLMPGLLVICSGIAVFGILRSETAVFSSGPEISLLGDNWFFASILYVAYNFVLGTVILSSLGDRPRYACVRGAITGGLILGLLAAITCKTLLLQGERVISHEIPMLALAVQLHPWSGRLYSLVLWTAILTTALSNGFGLLKRLESSISWPRPLLALAVLVPTFPFVGWPLAKAVGTIYPLLGYAGVVFILAVIRKIRLPARKI